MTTGLNKKATEIVADCLNEKSLGNDLLSSEVMPEIPEALTTSVKQKPRFTRFVLLNEKSLGNVLLSSEVMPEIPETMTTNEKNNRLLRYARNHGRGNEMK